MHVSIFQIHDRIYVALIELMLFENLLTELRLQGRETKTLFAIMPNYEIHRGVAQIANAIEQKDALGHLTNNIRRICARSPTDNRYRYIPVAKPVASNRT